ncbi:MAG: GDP-mannose 4,6-dehydratase [Gemmatimonadaceae bacterium]|nr:GDP-mannose 4,6-dehydratase [Gemmatimonadaceae bacterium]
MKRALVTGAAGFAGQWLCRALLRDGWEVTGASLTTPPPNGTLTDEERGAVRWMLADLRAEDAVADVLDASAPDAVFHLAGISFVPAAREAPVTQTNVLSAVVMLADLKRRQAAGAIAPTVVIVGSAEQYGAHDTSEGPLTEHADCRPRTLYAASKAAQEVFALEAARADGLRVVCTRSFNHSGPGQASQFLIPSLVRRALDARRAPAPRRITIGNGHTTRDFLHAEDVANAYLSLATRGVPGEVYNVCSGTGVTVEDLAREVCARAGVEADLESDPALRRAVDVPWLVGDHTKLRSTTGWTPRRSRTDIIDDLLNAPSH